MRALFIGGVADGRVTRESAHLEGVFKVPTSGNSGPVVQEYVLRELEVEGHTKLLYVLKSMTLDVAVDNLMLRYERRTG